MKSSRLPLLSLMSEIRCDWTVAVIELQHQIESANKNTPPPPSRQLIANLIRSNDISRRLWQLKQRLVNSSLSDLRTKVAAPYRIAAAPDSPGGLWFPSDRKARASGITPLGVGSRAGLEMARLRRDGPGGGASTAAVRVRQRARFHFYNSGILIVSMPTSHFPPV